MTAAIPKMTHTRGTVLTIKMVKTQGGVFTLSLYPDLAMTIRLVKGQFYSVKKIATLFGREESGSTLGVPESGLNGSGIESLRERDNAFCYESVMKEFLVL